MPCGAHPGQRRADDRVRRQQADLGGPEHSRQLAVLLVRERLLGSRASVLLSPVQCQSV